MAETDEGRPDQQSRRSQLRGHRKARLGGSPFWSTLPSIAAAVSFAVASLVWVVAGSFLPGGRWLAVHLFTLGVVTNVVLVFSDHFGRKLSKHDATRRGWYAPVANVGILAVLVGIPNDVRILVGLGAVVVTAVVVASQVRLLAMARAAGERRFGWIPRIYLWAHAAFVVGAVLGMAMGVGWIPGHWYAGVRVAHLHVNVLGWGGLTVLSTLAFFGPAIVRTRIAAGADDRAGQALGVAAPALFVAVTGLSLLGLGDGGATVARLVAAVALAVVATSVTVAVVPVGRAAAGANEGATRRPVVAVATWFVLAAWADVAVVATGAWRLLDAVGLAVFVGVLGQLIATVITYLVPLLRSRGFAGRDVLLARFERGEVVRTTVWNVGVATMVVAAVIGGGTVGGVLVRIGWGLVLVAVAWLLGAGLAPTPEPDEPSEWQPRSAAARRYRERNPADDTA